LNTYEAMFLFDPAAAHEWERVEAEIRRIMERAGAELLVCRKWDERKLAYEIRGRKRGCYVLTYFRAPGDRIAGIERDTKLSDAILRCLILRADEVSEEQMHAEHPPPSADRPRDRSRSRRSDRPSSQGEARPGEGKTQPATVPANQAGGTEQAGPEPAEPPARSPDAQAASSEPPAAEPT